jgi:hypothetical protein
MFNIHNLFSVTIYQGKILLPINIHKKILNFVEEKYEEKNTISCVNGFQYHKSFNGKKELNKIINKHMFSRYNLKIAHGWLNVLENKSYNKPHSHIGGTTKMAAVLYLSSENNNITFIRDAEYYEMKPKLFDYLVFPPELLHYVLPEERIEKRICYAFNLKLPQNNY